MGLPAALKAHAAKDYNTAATQYQRALDQKTFSPVLFQNYGALLRQFGKTLEAKKVYEQGISLYPSEISILRNYANLISDESPSKALALHFHILHSFFKSEDFDESSLNLLPIIRLLKDLSCNHWALNVCKCAINFSGLTPDLAIELISLIGRIGDEALSDICVSDLELLFKDNFSKLELSTRSEFLFSLSWLYFSRRNLEKGIALLNEARSSSEDVLSSLSKESYNQLTKTNDLTTWNASCILLKCQDFSLGWKYFDSGLRAPAQGSQAWQRALPKPFTHEQITLWRGESLIGKSILLLEEQAIGDVMQFMSLVPSLLSEARKVSVLVSDRLLPLYTRHYNSQIAATNIEFVSFDCIRNSLISPNSFDFQSPLGSICQYRFTHPRLYGKHIPCLTTNNPYDEELIVKYRSKFGIAKSSRIVGLSWRGGGTHSRIKQKSIPLSDLYQILKVFGDDVVFVSLQYGETSSTIEYLSKRGISVIVDDEIDPLKDMDSWLSQVALCDAVLSVANTTIHGAGGLGVPTLCLLSQHSDWRWFDDESVNQSYWYPSVSIFRESKVSGWSKAAPMVQDWANSSFQFKRQTPYTV